MTLLILLFIIIGVAAGVWLLAKRSAKPKESSLPMVVPPAPRPPVPPPSPAEAGFGGQSPPAREGGPLPVPPFTTPL